jgi:hypothetical protein
MTKNSKSLIALQVIFIWYHVLHQFLILTTLFQLHYLYSVGWYVQIHMNSVQERWCETGTGKCRLPGEHNNGEISLALSLSLHLSFLLTIKSDGPVNMRSWCSSVSILPHYRQTGWPGLDPRQRERIFPLASVSRPALKPTQLPIQSAPGVLSRGKERPGRDPNHSSHLLQRSRMSRSYTPLPLGACIAVAGQLYVTFHI